MYRTLYLGTLAIAPPLHLQRMMRERGGVNDFGEPIYRLCRTEARKRLAWGRWHDWPTGVRTRYKNPELNPALRSFIGVKPVPMYPGEHGWVLERYAPADAFGSPAQWYAPESMGGTKRWISPEVGYILASGHFPHRGDYNGTGYIFPTGPMDSPKDPSAVAPLSESIIANAIGRIEHARDGAPRDPFRRAKQEVYMAEVEEAKSEAEWTKFFNDQMDESLDELNARTPEARGEVGQYIQDSLGIREHPWD